MKIKKTSEKQDQRVTCLIYGNSGIGKTTLASTLTDKTLIISCESGLLSLQDFDIDYVEVEGKTAAEKLTSIGNVIRDLKNHDYKNIFIDSLTEISQIMVEFQMDRIGHDRSKSLVAWGEYNKQIKSFIKVMRDLSPFNVFMTALEKSDKDDFSRMFIKPDLQGSVATQLPQFFDEVFHYRLVQKEDNQVRVLVTQTIDTAIVKDRSGKLDKFEKPNLQNIINKIQGV